jgi:hypothetical protein
MTLKENKPMIRAKPQVPGESTSVQARNQSMEAISKSETLLNASRSTPDRYESAFYQKKGISKSQVRALQSRTLL